MKVFCALSVDIVFVHAPCLSFWTGLRSIIAVFALRGWRIHQSNAASALHFARVRGIRQFEWRPRHCSSMFVQSCTHFTMPLSLVCLSPAAAKRMCWIVAAWRVFGYLFIVTFQALSASRSIGLVLRSLECYLCAGKGEMHIIFKNGIVSNNIETMFSVWLQSRLE